MPRPPVPFHRGVTPEQLGRRRLVSHALGVTALALASWTVYGEFTHDHRNLWRGGLGVGVSMVIIYLSYHWAPRKVDQRKE